MVNGRLLKKIWLKNDELPIAIIRSSALKWFWSWLLGIFILISANFLLYFLLLKLEWLGLVIFLSLVFLSIIILLRTYWSWYYTGWILTNLRLIDIYQKGFFGKETSEIIYSQIGEIYAKSSGFLGGMFGFGDLYLQVSGGKAKFKLGLVRGYDRSVSEVLLQQENYQKNLINIKESESLRLLNKLKKKLGTEVFNKLIAD